jgi:hypothetical protein
MNSKSSQLTAETWAAFKRSRLYARWLWTRQLGLARDNLKLQECLLRASLAVFAASREEDDEPARYDVDALVRKEVSRK